jgi:hypothetical protein
MGKAEGKRQLGRPRCTRKSNIKVDLKERELETQWINVVVGKNKRPAVVKKENEPLGFIK